MPRPRRNRLTCFLVAAILIVGSVATGLAYLSIRELVNSGGLAGLPGKVFGAFRLPEVKLPAVLGGQALGPTPEPWNGTSRVTVLVMGLDYRDWENGDVPRSDSMWLFTIDPVGKTAGMMSIPRDTWVSIPGFGESKINMAYFYGEVNKLPGGGPELAVRTVEQFLDININYYAVVDFNAFSDFIDKLDGIWVDVPEEITVDPLGPGNTVTLEPGRQRLFGAVALGYARNRYTAGGDFDRMKRQMQVIDAIRERVMDPKYLPVLLAHSGDVYNLVANGVRTNLGLKEAVQLAWLGREVPPEQIHKVVLDQEVMTDSWSAEGWSIQVPDMQKIRRLRDEIFKAVPVQLPAGNPADLAEQAKSEQAKIIVQNGTGVIGLAGRTSEYLKSLGLNVGEPTDADGFYQQTTLIDSGGKSVTLGYLAKIMNVDATRILSRSDPNAQADVIVIVGDDWANNNSMP